MHALPEYIATSSVTVDWDEASDPNTLASGIGGYELYKASSPYAPYVNTSPSDTYYDDNGGLPSEGTTYSYKVRAFDNSEGGFGPAPNFGEFSEEASTIPDFTPPSTSDSQNCLLLGNLGWCRGDVEVTLSATDALSGVNATYYCEASTAGDPACTPDTEYEGPFLLSNEGSNYVCYYSVDNVGNEEAAHCTGEIKIDKTRPYGQGVSFDNQYGDGFLNTSLVSASLTVGSDDVSGLDYCEADWNDGSSVQNTGLSSSASHTYADGDQKAS